MNARDIIKQRLEHKGTAVTPSTIICEPELDKKLAEYYKDENWYSKKVRQFMNFALEVDTLHETIYDETYTIDGFGSLWIMNKKPWHLEIPGMKEPSFNGYEFPSIQTFVQPILDVKPAAIKQYEQDNERYRVIYMMWGIFEHTWRARGFENALVDMLINEEFYQELLTRITDLYIAMIDACADVPADAFFISDDWCDQRGVLMGKETWRKFIRPCYERLFDAIKKQGKKILHHCCGTLVDIYDDLIEMGLDCHESVQPEAKDMEPSNIKQKWGDKISFWGCLGNQGILYHGTPKEIEQEILRLDRLFKNDGGFILAPSKPLPDEMPVEKAVAVIETIAGISC